MSPPAQTDRTRAHTGPQTHRVVPSALRHGSLPKSARRRSPPMGRRKDARASQGPAVTGRDALKRVRRVPLLGRPFTGRGLSQDIGNPYCVLSGSGTGRPSTRRASGPGGHDGRPAGRGGRPGQGRCHTLLIGKRTSSRPQAPDHGHHTLSLPPHVLLASRDSSGDKYPVRTGGGSRAPVG